MRNYTFYGSMSQIPSSIGALINLKCLAICGVPELTTLPDSIGMLQSLTELDISSTSIRELPYTIVNLKGLKVLKMNRSHMQKLPKAMGMLEKLEEIYGENCLRLEMIPGDIQRLHFLKILKLTKTRVQNVPQLPQSLVSLCLSSTAIKKAPKITNLVSLRNLELCFTNSTSIEAFPKARTYSPCCMLELPRFTHISSYWGRICCLKELQLIDCDNLSHLGQLPSGLRKLEVHSCNLLEVVDLCNLGNLQLLLIDTCPELVEIQGLDRLELLERLSIKGCNSLRRLPNLSNFKKLKIDWW
ncbi:hypothetical protein BT93_C1020 [Corymbia citriodora subsp. variegata]|nr:hypothetical protein BT93_C1020 [Corymbia citriodora subsp. variegata]